jgi:tetratricopeptide (TPR) repeat protein
VAQIIRTCDLSFVKAVCAAGAAIVSLGVSLAASQTALAKPQERSALSSYFQGRMFDKEGDPANALAGYAQALNVEPNNSMIAIRVYRQALMSGNKREALRALQQLQTSNAVPNDAQFLLLADRLDANDIQGARLIVDRIEEQGAFGFAVPILRAWLGVAARDANPLIALDAVQTGSMASDYTVEHKALLLFALKKYDDAYVAARAITAGGSKGLAIRIAAASSLAEAGQSQRAQFFLLTITTSADQAAIILSKKTTSMHSVNTGQQGIAFMLARLSEDLIADRSVTYALTMARYARLFDAQSEYVKGAEINALAAAGLNQDALNSIENFPALGVRKIHFTQFKPMLLERLGRNDEALRLLSIEAAKPNASVFNHIQLGEIQDRLKLHKKAAQSYGNAIALSKKSGQPESDTWYLWMLRGSALERAEQWNAAKSALAHAHVLAPSEAAPANQLGYAMLERRETLPEALRLIKIAHAAKPMDVAIMDSLGWAYYLNNDLDKAMETLEKATASDPYEPTIAEHLGDVYWTAGRRIDARHSWSAAKVNAESAALERLKSKQDIGLTPDNAAR